MRLPLLVLVALALALLGQGAPAASAVAAMTMAAGEAHTCAVTTGGELRCWGNNFVGQLGDGTTIDRTTSAAVTGLSSGVAAASAGGGHACAVTTGGALKCWGGNSLGQLGDGTTSDRTTPVAVTGLGSDVAAVSAGAFHTCALTTGGGLMCWGSNGAGQLGDGSTTNRTTPVTVTGLSSGVAALAAGDEHTCALTTGGALKCWGANYTGQLGDGTTVSSTTPVAVSGLTSGGAALSAGNLHSCSLITGGGLKCWGDNFDGQLGDGTTGDPSCTCRTAPVDVTGLSSGVTAVESGGGHTCARTTAGGLKCWGANYSGQLGDGTTVSSTTPVDVTGLSSGVAAVAAGGFHACAITTEGGLKCWGFNESGQLGDGTTGDLSCTCRTTPVDVVGLQPGSDADGDGVPDASDNCPTVANGAAQAGTPGVGNQTNTDMANQTAGFRLGVGSPPPLLNGDTLGDACDPDDDNEGFSDVTERRIYGVSGGSAQERIPCRTSAVTDPWSADFYPFGSPNFVVDTSEVSFILGFVGKAPASLGYSVRLDLLADNPGNPGTAGVIDTREVSLIRGFVGLSCVSP